MVSSVFSVDVVIRSRHGERTIVWLEGEHDIATLTLLTDTLTTAICADDADLVIDLSKVTFLSVATIDELIRSRNILRQQSRTLTVRSPSRGARRLLDVCRLTDLIEPEELD